MYTHYISLFFGMVLKLITSILESLKGEFKNKRRYYLNLKIFTNE